MLFEAFLLSSKQGAADGRCDGGRGPPTERLISTPSRRDALDLTGVLQHSTTGCPELAGVCCCGHLLARVIPFSPEFL